MPADTGVVEKGAHVGRMREGLPPVSPFLAEPPQDLPSVEGELTRIESQRAALESLHGWEAVERTKFALLEQQGELEVAMAYFGGHIDSLTGKRVATINEETDKRLARSRKKDRLKVKTVFEVDGEEITNLLLARKKIAEQVLLERIEVVLQARDEVDPGGNLSSAEFAAISDPKDKGKLYAAELIPQAIHPFVVAREMEAGEETYGAVAEFDSMKDEVANLDASATRSKIEKAAKLLPEAATISTLWPTEIGRIYGKAPSSPGWQSATYLAKAGAEAAVRVVNAGTGRRPTDTPLALEGPDPRDPSKSAAIDMTGMATRALDSARGRRADRMYQSDSLSCGDFDQAAEVMSRQAAKREEALGWKLLARFRHYVRESVTAFSGDPSGFKSVSAMSLEQAKAASKPWLMPSEDQNAVLEDENVRKAIGVYYGQIRAGEIVFGGKGQTYRVEADGSAAKPIGYLPIADRVALEVLHSWGVHSSPFLEAPAAGETAREKQARELRNERRQVAWNTYKGDHDGIRKLYPYNKYIEEGNPPLYLEATGTPDFTLIMENPDEPGQWFLGDYLQMQGLTTQDLLTKWDEIKRKKFGKGPGWFWAQIDKGVETSKGWGDLIKEGLLTPEAVWQKLGKEAYGYLPAPLKRQILRPLYALADQSMINLIMTQAGIEGAMKKTDLLNLVMTKGLKMFELYELTGIYFSTVAGTGRVASQIEAMRSAYLGAHPGAVAEADQYVFGLTGIRAADGMPDTYSAWRKMVGNNLLRLEGYIGTVDALLEEIKSGRYKYKDKAVSKNLAGLLLKDPVAEIIDRLTIEIQEKNWADFQDWLGNLRRDIGEGKLPPEELLKQMLQKIAQQRGEDFFDAGKLTQAERILDKLDRQESFFSRLKTSDGLVHQRWPTPLSFAFTILPDLPLIGPVFKFLGKPGVHASIDKWLGANPASAILGTAGWLGYIGVQAWLVGGAPALITWTSSFWIATLAGSIMTDTMHLINEHIFQFTRHSYEQFPVSPKKK